jgi:hypothetical protein
MAQTGATLYPSLPATLHHAGSAWKSYGEQRPRSMECPACGAANNVHCRRCQRPLAPRQHIIADFLIGAHALHHADRLLTRDRGFYGRYFPDLKLA